MFYDNFINNFMYTLYTKIQSSPLFWSVYSTIFDKI